MNARILALLVALVPSLSLAHPGHGETEPSSWLHFMTEPVHVLSLAVVLVALVALVAVRWRRSDGSERTGR